MTKTDDAPIGEGTPLLGTVSDDKREIFQSFRRKSAAKLSIRHQDSQRSIYLKGSTGSKLGDDDVEGGGSDALVVKHEFTEAYPVEGLAPLFPNGGIKEYDGRAYVPYREASLVKSTPAFAPYRRKARHRSFYLWWTNVSIYYLYLYIMRCTSCDALSISIHIVCHIISYINNVPQHTYTHTSLLN